MPDAPPTSRRWVRDPAAQFIAIGVLLFVVHAALADDTADREPAIEIPARYLADAERDFVRSYGAAPTDAELAALAQRYADDEMLYREALRLGLDRDDAIVRRRLIQKVEFLAEDLSVIGEPSDDELSAHLAAHADRYRVPPAVELRQVFFSVDDGRDRALARARDAVGALPAVDATAAAAIGDPLEILHHHDLAPVTRYARVFGDAFAAELERLPVGEWVGPVESALGVHVVRIDARRPARPASLAEVRPRVRDDVIAERRDAARERLLARLRRRYPVRFVRPPAVVDAIARAVPR